MMKKSMICLIMAALTALCSCSPGESSQEVQTARYQTSTNFKYAEGFSLPKDTQTGIYTFSQYGGGMGRIDALSAIYFSEEERKYADRTEQTEYGEDLTVPYAELRYEKKELHLSGNGYFYYFDERAEPDGAEYFNGKPVFERDFADTEVALRDGSVRLDELCATAQSYLTDSFTALGVKLEAKPVYALIHKAESDYAELFFGLDTGDGAVVKMNEYWTEEPEMELCMQFRVCMASSDKPFEVQSMFELMIPEGCDDKRDHIDCDEAIVGADAYLLSASPHLKLLYAQLEYLPYVESFDRTLWGEGFEHQYGAVYKAEPAWALYFEKEDGSHQLIYVNAINGKIEAARAPF